MIHCLVIEQLGKQSTQISHLIDLYKKGDSSFSTQVITWLEKTEETMSKLHLTEGGEMSVLRGRILKFTDVYRKPDEKITQSTLRKGKSAEAASVLERAEEIIRNVIERSEERLLQFENKLCEGMTAFLLENELPARQINYMSWLNQIWRMLKIQPSTKALAIYISTSLGSYDRSYILDKLIVRIFDQEIRSPERIE